MGTSGEDDYEMSDSQRAEERKREVGMAPYGTPKYWRNAKYILKSYSNPNEETRRKLSELEENGY